MIDVQREGDCFFVTWPEDRLGFAFDRITESNWGRVSAEVTVHHVQPGKRQLLAGPFTLGLSDLEQQQRQSVILARRDGISADKWHQYLLSACSRVLSAWRKPADVLNLRHVPNSEPVKFLVPNMLQAGETNLLYGDGESAKSLLALLIVLCCGTGHRLPWGAAPASICKPLILDWETNEVTVATRMRRLCDGLRIDVPDLAYHRMARPLTDCLPDLKAEIAHEKYDLLLIDSIGFATRGSLVDDGVARGALSDLRDLGAATKLVVAHVPAADARKETGPSRPFGSVWFWNGMRQGWEVRKSEDSTWETIDVGLYHRKSNDGARLRDFGLSINFDGINGPITISSGRIDIDSDLASYTRLSARLYDILKSGCKSLLELKDVTGEPMDSIEHALATMPTVIRLEDKNIWKYGLVDQRRA